MGVIKTMRPHARHRHENTGHACVDDWSIALTVARP